MDNAMWQGMFTFMLTGVENEMGMKKEERFCV